MLYEEVVEVKERLVLVQEKCGISYSHHGVVAGKSDVKVSDGCIVVIGCDNKLLFQIHLYHDIYDNSQAKLKTKCTSRYYILRLYSLFVL